MHLLIVLQIGYLMEWEKLLIIILQEWQLQVMIQCFYLKWIQIKFQEPIKLWLKHTNLQEKGITEFKINWNIVSWPGSAWASRVFPELPLDEAIVKLADAIFDASRASMDDPIQAWDDHNERLRIKTNWLNEKKFCCPSI